LFLIRKGRKKIVMNMIKYVFVAGILFGSVIQALSQVSFSSLDTGSDFNRAMELYNKEKYPAAIRLFDAYIAGNDNSSIGKNEAEYFRSMASLKLFNPDAEYRVISYIRAHPESPRINEAYLALGDYFFQNKTYRKAVTYLEQVNRQELNPAKLPEYFFRLGYSLYSRGNKPRALLMFSEIKDIDTEYSPAAIYYFSHIAYEQKMYLTAMEGFSRLKDDETFGSVVPFYMVQILYIQKNYDEILRMAPDLLESAPKERAVELYRFIGDAYYNKKNFTEALPYLEKFATGTRISGREDKYQLGYCYYKAGDIDKAIKTLLAINTLPDLLSQNIWYVLADCYVKTGNKKRAQFGFQEASKLDFDKKIREDALFNYALITYETSFSPFNEAIASFQDYIDQYPNSDRIETAYNYLVSSYMQARNYKAALESLEKIRHFDTKLEAAYQRVAFFRGLELFKNLEFNNAASMFDRSLKFGKHDNILKARALYWRGEARYRLADYGTARADYIEFMGIPGAMELAEYNMVRYNLGYAHFNLKEYPDALTHLLAFESYVTTMKPDLMADARNRIADCYFITTRYPLAVDYYDKVIDFGKTDADYAMFQKGFSLGLMNDVQGKIDVLTTLVQRYPSSSWIPNAMYERGRARVILEDYEKGETDFKTIISTYSETAFVPRAIVQLGLLYYNTGRNEEAIAAFTRVIENYKTTPEARHALTGLRNTYIEMNDVEKYFAYAKTIQGYGDVKLSEKDSLLYASGENFYIEGKYDRASAIFDKYLIEFPVGSFLQNARFYLAVCRQTEGREDDALNLYTAVADAPNNQFTEPALSGAAGICFDREDFQRALEYYEKLEKSSGNSEMRITALRGELKSAYRAGSALKAIEAANKITSGINIPEELFREAVFTRAKANFSLNNHEEALKDFRKIATEVASSEGAESTFRVAELLFEKGEYSESERVIDEFIDRNTPHQYWMGRIFLLRADISARQGDMIMARATLQSLKDYYTIDNDGILDEAKAKLDTLNQVR
jgi:tetratricopeptide (TPR) repeat protein